MRNLALYKLSKLLIYVFLIYINWYQYVYGVNHFILYGSVVLAVICMVLDLLVTPKNIREIFPTGVLINIVMCVYSLVFGLYIAKNQEALVNSVKTYIAFTIVCLVICYISNEVNSFSWLLNVIIVIDVICALFVLTRGYYWKGYGYVLSRDNNPNVFGMAMDLGLFCLIYQTRRMEKKYNYGYKLNGPLFICDYWLWIKKMPCCRNYYQFIMDISAIKTDMA